jgi:peptide/nickel transport system permease protein
VSAGAPTAVTSAAAAAGAAVRGLRRLPPLTLVGLAILIGVAVCAAFAPLLSGWGPTELDFDAVDAAPGVGGHLLGTDQNGMDIWSRIVHAARLDLGVAVASVGLAVVVGGVIGAVVGYIGGWVDEVAMRVMDIVQSFPAFVLALAVATLLGRGTEDLIAVIALVNAPSYVRLLRSEVRATRELGYVEAARAAGESRTSILFRHVVPNSLRPALVVAPLNCGWAVLTLAGLSFVGLGVPIPEPEWGAMIASGAEGIVSGHWWTSVVPGLALFVTVLGFNLVGEGLLDRQAKGRPQ